MVRHSLAAVRRKPSQLSHFSETNINDVNCRLPQPIIDWLETHLEALKAIPCRPRDGYTGEVDAEILDELWDALNAVVFKGALPRRLCSWEFVPQGTDAWEENDDDREKATGTSTDERHSRPRHLTVRSHIKVFEIPVGEGEEYFPAMHLRGYIGTLLHEMVHSLISIYVCDCKICYADPNNPDGKTGHGKGWTELAHTIEVFAKKMMNIDLDLGVVEAVAEELVTTREPEYEWPLEELGIDLEELEGHVERIFLAKYCTKATPKG